MTGKHKLSEKNIEEALEQVKTALLEADVPYSAVTDFLKQVSSEVMGQKVHEKLNPGTHFIKIVKDKLLFFLGSQNSTVNFTPRSVITVMGLQGSGKTTTVAKIAYRIKKGKKVLVASVDFYRPAAIDQLETLAKQNSINFYRATTTDPIEATKEIINYFKNDRFDVLFLDTAGRLHVDVPMMEELKKVKAIINPTYSFLVLDSMTGQESLNVAQEFEKNVGFQSAILTKMDSDTRGGAAFAFRYVMNKEISFIGTGEKIDDLELFIPDRIASRILGMGDVMSLIEKAEAVVPQPDQEVLTKRIMSGNFSLDDFAAQLSFVDKIGSFQKILKYIPGAGTVSQEQIEQGEREIKAFRAIISSMTPKERAFPKILDGSRKARIAKGSGTNAQIINQLLQKFEQSKHFVKMFKKY